jgi:membrane protease YdiL (CAAX protease family)
MGTLAATMFAHAMFACIVALLPFRGLVRYRRLKRGIETGIPHTKVRFYRGSVLWQLGVVGVVLGYWMASGVPAAWLGLVLPEQFGVTLGVTVVSLLAIAASIRALRTKGDSQLKLLIKSAGAILPLSSTERRWFAALAVGAGISEELLTRGFLIFYLWQYLPGRDVSWTVAASAAIFGYCHLYQGWRYMIATGLLGAGLAWFYLTTGSLLGPIILHIALDLRLIFIFTPARLQALADQNAEANLAAP